MIKVEPQKFIIEIDVFDIRFNIDIHSVYQMYINAYLANEKSTFEEFVMSEVHKIIYADVARKGFKKYAISEFNWIQEDIYFKVFGKVIVNK